ncbi:Crp/Fnr family transcriptional regulator [Vibrio hannami]|uniref:Crp/Fnr family transcriptional regulator n=1 Tax=Vibrio hannami TaxID=2717094 RepID=UPI00240EC0F4|nr:Crp/Fnr family transcriptional regulator [Vibrio hannami]MDG3087016.1 Crp/Fnr family transcriptional regulator [Vibrio hannami]
MDKVFLEQLVSHNFTSSEIDEISALVTPLELPTRHILVNQGDTPTHFYFVIEGLCHANYLTDDGKQFSKEFYWEQDWIIGFESLISEKPSPFLLETLTPAMLLCIPFEYLKQWRIQNNPLYLKLLETQLMYKENKERFMLLYSPQERYELFCQSYPDLETRLSDYQIAAYLGITPISLSRIKGRIKENN